MLQPTVHKIACHLPLGSLPSLRWLHGRGLHGKTALGFLLFDLFRVFSRL